MATGHAPFVPTSRRTVAAGADRALRAEAGLGRPGCILKPTARP